LTRIVSIHRERRHAFELRNDLVHSEGVSSSINA